jgi:general secretion pathway protein F
MPSFRYAALNSEGQRLSGVMDGATRGDIIEELNRAGLFPIEATEAQAAGKRSWRELLTPEPSAQNITALTLDLVMLLDGGVTLSDALALLQHMGGTGWRHRVTRDLHRAIASGRSFSAALAEHPRLFSPIYIKMVEVAESTGRLKEALASLAAERQRAEAMQKRVINAITYPAFLIVSAISAMSVIFLYVIPQFETAIEGFRDKIAPEALFVFNLSELLRANIQSIYLGLGLLALVILVVGQLGQKKRIWVRLLARLPGLHTLFLYEATQQFCRTLGVLIANGIDITTSLRLTRDVLRLPSMALQMDEVIADVRRGRRVSDAVENHTDFPRHVVQILRVGEESGRLPDSANRIATLYGARLDATLSTLIAVLGPLTMVIVAMLIAWLIISVITALLSVNDLLK